MNATPPIPSDVDHPSGDVGNSVGDVSSRVENARFELVVDSETKLFPLSWIPIQTATAIHRNDSRSEPQPPEGKYEAQVAYLTKLSADGEGGPTTENLTESDRNELDDLWKALPPIRLPATKAQFAPYEAAVLRSRDQLSFDLQVMTSIEGWAPESRIFEATSRHRELLKEQVLKGLIVPRNEITMEAAPGQWGAGLGLTLDELRKFTGQFLVSVRVDAAVARDDMSSVTPKTAANPMGAPWRREGLGVLERREQLLAKFRQLGGSVDKDGKLHSDTHALATLARLDGRKKDTLREQLQKAAKAEASTSEADADSESDSDASTASKWFPQPSSPATRKR